MIHASITPARPRGAAQIQPTAAVRYLGSKVRVLEPLLSFLGPPTGSGLFVDAFCGTGVVAAAAATRGWRVRVNDHLHSAVTLATASLIAAPEARFAALGSYGEALSLLNQAEPQEGFFWREYSPASATGRMYFTEENARRIDAARSTISAWTSARLVNEDERRLLLADLILAAARVANTAGRCSGIQRNPPRVPPIRSTDDDGRASRPAHDRAPPEVERCLPRPQHRPQIPRSALFAFRCARR